MIFSKKKEVKPQPTVAEEMEEITKTSIIMRKRELRAQVYPAILSKIREAAQLGSYTCGYHSRSSDINFEDRQLIREILLEDGFYVSHSDQYGIYIKWKKEENEH